LIAGDAFTTVEQESFINVITQKKEVHGPPSYFTPEWEIAWDSVKILSSLNPYVVITGHGSPLYGEQLTSGLKKLSENFVESSIPKHSRYSPKN
jgi:predicted metal-dependent phosphotriesterase family hydrolase